MQNKWNKYSDTRFQALTSLRRGEFEELLLEFQPIVEKYFIYHTFTGAIRRRALFKEQRNSCLYGAEAKLFFILYYLKNNSLQESIGAFFGMSQSKVSIWTRQLLPLLEQSLSKLGRVSTQSVEKIYSLLEGKEDGFLVYQDATVRPIEQSTDRAVEREFYDGKHKTHTVKNHIICDQDGEIIYVSPLYEGKKHDRQLIADEALSLPCNITLIQDTGFMGFEHEGMVFMPKKKPRNKELSQLDKCLNSIISSIRVKVEHVIGSVKTLRMIKEKIRLKTDTVRQQVFVIASAIHNLKQKSRSINIQS